MLRLCWVLIFFSLLFKSLLISRSYFHFHSHSHHYYTNTLTIQVQGIWSDGYDGTEVSTVALSHSYNEVPVIVSGDNFGRVKLFNYPSLHPGSPDKCYRGHCGHINRIVFSCNDKYCISIGGEDRCIFVWSTDILDEIRERRALAAEVLNKSSTFALQGMLYVVCCMVCLCLCLCLR